MTQRQAGVVLVIAVALWVAVGLLSFAAMRSCKPSIAVEVQP